MPRTSSTQVAQIESNGTIINDVDRDNPRFEEQAEIIENGLVDREWSVTFEESDLTKKRHVFLIEKGECSLKIIAYMFANLKWSSGGRSHEEKRIQLSRPYDEHAEDFQLSKDGPERCALMGIYRRDELTLFCAWDSEAYLGHAQPTSCYVRVEGMADAARTGFGQSRDSKGRLVCCFTPDLLAYYLSNMSHLHEHLIAQTDMQNISEGVGGNEDNLELPNEAVSISEDVPRNRVIYGAPGTGKSHALEQDLTTHFPSPDQWERTTFHPETTYGTFIGEYRPTPVYRDGGHELVDADGTTPRGTLEPLIDYVFVPGPFLRMLVRAVQNPEHGFALVIEELNRANAAATFGEAFQLLDRDENGAGRYEVTLPSEAQTWLRSRGLGGAVRLPPNLYLWATMNSADQGVLPLDAAFKRRWSFQYVGLDKGEEHVTDWMIKLKFLDDPIPWNRFRKAINTHLQKRDVAEDRLLGPFFLNEREVGAPGIFENKLLQYLRDDVVRSAPDMLFREGSLSYGALVQRYRNGENVFDPDISFDEA